MSLRVFSGENQVSFSIAMIIRYINIIENIEILGIIVDKKLIKLYKVIIK